MGARRWLAGVVVSLLVAAAWTGAAVAQPEPEMARSVDNQPTAQFGGVDLLRPENALLTRYDDRVEIEIRLDTPVPGSYTYPDEIPQERYAAPELFTMWAFVFNRPESCVGEAEPPRCGPDDFSEAVRAGVYNVAAHVTSIDHSGGAFELDRGTDGQVILRGEIVVAAPPRPNSPPGADVLRFPLEDPAGAEIHVAIAPHGQMNPAALAIEAYEPAGNPACGCWWVASFVAAPDT
ncbi:MAG: hypothetical protein ACC726_02555 [Chloroflexota bacterium]